MKLILTRHGETEENKNGIIQGHLSGTLSKEGIQQAKKLAKRLKKEEIDIIYSSDLKRAVDTAKEIAKYHKKIDFIITKELREVYLGPFEGKENKTINWKKYHTYKGVEQRPALRKRIKLFFDKVYKNHKNKKVLFVGHNAVNKALIGIIIGLSINDMNKVKQFNTAVSVFEINEDKNHKIHLLNCTKHLD